MKKALKVLHCPTNVGGNPQALARAERALGLKSFVVSYDQDYLGYATDEVLFDLDERELKRAIKRWRLLWRAARKFDIVHYNFGSTILLGYDRTRKIPGARYPRVFYNFYNLYRRLEDARDLALLKRMGKGIVVTYQGDDARQGDFCRANFAITAANEVEPDYYTPESDNYKRLSIARFARYADRIYALNPDLLHVLPPQAEFLPYANVDPREWTPPADASSGQSTRLTVLHAPTHRRFKGTHYIMEAVGRLQNQDKLDFEFTLVEGLPNAEAKKIYERADILIDQLLGGWYGGLAVEFMSLGKPVMCHIREEDLKFLPPQMRNDLPIINANPANIYNVLKEWLTTRKHELTEAGARSRAYVENWHDPMIIAQRLKNDYENIIGAK